MKQFSLFFLLFISTTYGQNEFLDAYKALQPKESLQLNISFSDSLGNQSDLPLVVMKGKQDGPVLHLYRESTALNSLLSLQCKNLYKKSMQIISVGL